jgi:hypothetical protein
LNLTYLKVTDSASETKLSLFRELND